MPPPARRPIELEPGTPLADAVTRARAAAERADADGVDAAYREAVGLAAGDLTLWSALAADHVEALRRLGRVTLALQRCDGYVAEAGPNQVSLRLLRAGIRSAVGDHSGAGADAAAIHTALSAQSHALTADDRARLHRVEGLAAAEWGDLDRAAGHLDAARRIFHGVGNQAGVAAIEVDRVLLQIRQGDESAVVDVLSGETPQTVSDYLLLAAALRRQLRYQEAFLVLYRGLDADIDPALRWHVLSELILLLRLIRQDGAAELLLLELHQAVAASADPVTAAAAAARLSATGAAGDALSPQFDRRVQHARQLIIETRLEEAGSLLGELRSRAHTDRDVSTWHLASGELELARRTRSRAQAAVDHLIEAVTRASAVALVEVRVCALRSLGHAHARLDADDQAAECWAEAHRLEGGIAGRQLTDTVRIGMLQGVADEYDERIQAAAEKLHTHGPEAAAAIVVAMEAARGAMILERILPGKKGFARDLPRPSDLNGAWRWVSDIADGLPPSQAVWIMHSAPDGVHHAVLGRGLLFHDFVSVGRKKLTAAIDDLMACWDEQYLDASMTSGELDGEHATPARLRAELALRRHHQVRIDSHGNHDDADPTRSWLALAPEGPDGYLRPAQLQGMDLRGCGPSCSGPVSLGWLSAPGEMNGSVSSGLPSTQAPRQWSRPGGRRPIRWPRRCSTVSSTTSGTCRAISRCGKLSSTCVAGFPALRGTCLLWSIRPDGAAGRSTGTRAGRPEPARSGAGCAAASTSGGAMWHPAESHPPQVFVSYAGNDRPAAERLRQDLRERDIETFAFPPGGTSCWTSTVPSRSRTISCSVEEKFGGAVGMRFYYRLKKADEPISVDSGKLADSQIVNGSTIDLEVQVEAFGPVGYLLSSSTGTCRRRAFLRRRIEL